MLSPPTEGHKYITPEASASGFLFEANMGAMWGQMERQIKMATEFFSVTI
jgi:hypothetical protein